MVDYSNKKVPIFSGINDQPIAPTADSGGNISHLYDLYNQVLDILTTDITNIEAQLAAINNQLNPSEPTLEVFEFSGINAVDPEGIGNTFIATVGTIPKTGKLQKIAIDSIFEGYDTFFSLDGGNNVLTLDSFEIATEGYQWVVSNDGSQDVTQGQELTFTTISEELNRTVYLYIYG